MSVRLIDTLGVFAEILLASNEYDRHLRAEGFEFGEPL
jgi:hypothetical protein